MIGSIIGGIICIMGGLLLCLVKGAESQRLIVSISQGAGVYCIGKGIYTIFQGRQLCRIKNLAERDNKVVSKFIEVVQENTKIGAIVERIYERYHIASLVRYDQEGKSQGLPESDGGQGGIAQRVIH